MRRKRRKSQRRPATSLPAGNFIRLFRFFRWATSESAAGNARRLARERCEESEGSQTDSRLRSLVSPYSLVDERNGGPSRRELIRVPALRRLRCLPGSRPGRRSLDFLHLFRFLRGAAGRQPPPSLQGCGRELSEGSEGPRDRAASIVRPRRRPLGPDGSDRAAGPAGPIRTTGYIGVSSPTRPTRRRAACRA
jgi:hypothetical protein